MMTFWTVFCVKFDLYCCLLLLLVALNVVLACCLGVVCEVLGGGWRGCWGKEC